MAARRTIGRVTLDRLDQKLDDVIGHLDKFTRQFEDHTKKDDEMYIKVDRLDQSEQRRTWHFRTIWTAMLALASAIGLAYFK